MNKRKLLERALVHPESLRFTEVLALAEAFGFRVARVRGSHHILSHAGVREFINLQDVGGTAKPYQVRQLLELTERYNLSLGGDE
ncbi:MAG: type II toxin-antitoxin system HicA family toxin [Candidatus Bipolaricaulis sp.]|jgi:predicted RNA binding protein YcfA (HicA-like mRNA interferase family)|nr:type II toxin-antitoxin system HicA family toxin [Candidatus Bipolaricaulis sp.]MDD5219356.1 type II toxin-antitoxin system HicA family toxin [Candidatus Bipolaricaulis sp.]MDD5645708.1 type II toxin-antitoxin system HicA family toxin [Candidatus Bipolaricaulis sp.]